MDHLDAHGSAGPDLRGVAGAFRRAIADGLMCAATEDLVADAPRVIAEAVNAELGSSCGCTGTPAFSRR